MPRAFSTVRLATTVVPACLSDPVMMPVFGVQHQPCGQILGREVQGRLAGGGDQEEQRAARRAAGDPRAVDGRPGRSLQHDVRPRLLGAAAATGLAAA